MPDTSTCMVRLRCARICRETDVRKSGEQSRLLVVGTGLIGTSVALAARGSGYEVWLDDLDPERLAMAVSVGAGVARTGDLEHVDVAVAAVPPASVATVIHELIGSGVAATVTHLASVQLQPQLEVEAVDPGYVGFVGSHPIAGRERSGPHHGAAELFAQRPWIVCPTPHSDPSAVAAVCDLAEACGAVVTVMAAEMHDELLARLSHAPQLLASALAASLLGLERDAVSVAGTGLRDTTRLADSDPALWAEIVAANPAAVASALRTVIDPLAALIGVLEVEDPTQSAAAVSELVGRGRLGRDLLAGKHGQKAVRWATVSVVVPDEAGGLARLLVDAADAGVNVEDIRVDHSPGQPLGIVELDVAPVSGEPLERALVERGWAATASPPAPE
jgi:prephenate dehydrogenase